jgi:hypothetical protein
LADDPEAALRALFRELVELSSSDESVRGRRALEFGSR